MKEEYEVRAIPSDRARRITFGLSAIAGAFVAGKFLHIDCRIGEGFIGYALFLSGLQIRMIGGDLLSSNKQDLIRSLLSSRREQHSPQWLRRKYAFLRTLGVVLDNGGGAVQGFGAGFGIGGMFIP